jgi:hypothetical protein
MQASPVTTMANEIIPAAVLPLAITSLKKKSAQQTPVDYGRKSTTKLDRVPDTSR